MTTDAMLAARLIAGAYQGSLVLTIAEVRQMIEQVHPEASVVIDGRTIVLADLPVFVIDNIDPFPELDAEAWQRQLLASLAEGLIDAEDVEHLWRKP